MTRTHLPVWTLLLASLIVGAADAQVLSEQKLLDAASFGTPGYLMTYQTTFTRDTSRGDPAGLIVDMPYLWSVLGQRWSTPRNWTSSNAFALKLENLNSAPARLVLRFETNSNFSAFDQHLVVIPGLETVTIVYDLDLSAVRAFGLKSLPSGYATPHMQLVANSTVNLGSIHGWQFYNRGTNPVRLRVWDVKRIHIDTSAVGRVDAYGQPAFGTWPGKITSLSDFATQRAAEEIDLNSHPGPGGLQGTGSLPSQPPSSKWRTLRLPSGKWYFVHPSGKLFWSMGITTVRATEGTPLAGREPLFMELPERFPGSPHYQTILVNGSPIETVNFATHNLELKNGAGWQAVFASQAVRRLKSWGFNTIGDWTEPRVLAQSDVPYIVGVTTNEFPTRVRTPISARTVPDPFDPAFRSFVADALASAIAPHNGRPEFLGVYVDGELPWGYQDTHRNRAILAIMVLKSPASQPARQAFITLLQKQYRSLTVLNTAWGTSFPTWASIGDPGPGATAVALSDCRAFVSQFATQYYYAVSRAFTTSGCTGLYLGSREGWQTTPEVVAVANRYVDVFSMGIYQRPELINWAFPGIDKPLLLSEFSFGSTDRGMWHPGPVPNVSQSARAAIMREFFLAALQTKKIVGAHWFQYMDQHVSGRFDGENYNMGFVTTADTPHSEMVTAARSLGASLYSIRGQ